MGFFFVRFRPSHASFFVRWKNWGETPTNIYILSHSNSFLEYYRLFSRGLSPRIGEEDFGHLTSDFETATPSPSTSTLKSEVRSLKSKMCPHDRMQVSFSAFHLSSFAVKRAGAAPRRKKALLPPFNHNKRKHYHPTPQGSEFVMFENSCCNLCS